METNFKAEDSTRVDGDIAAFINDIFRCNGAEENSIIRLLDSMRIKFRLDAVCVFEEMVNEKGVECLYGSYSREKYHLTGKTFPMSHADYRRNADAYDADGLSEKHMIPALDGQMACVLHFGFLRQDAIDGAVEFGINGEHSWTGEERLALRRAGIIIKSIVTGIHMGKLDRERKRMAQEQERTILELLDSISCGILRFRARDNRILSVNQAALDILGYRSKEELQADNFDGVENTVMEEDRKKLARRRSELRNIGDEGYIEYRVCHPDGKLLYVYGDIRKMMDAEGNEIFQKTLVDVTKQRLLEMELFRGQTKRALDAEAQKAEALAASNKQREILLSIGKLFMEICHVNVVTNECQFVYSDGGEKFADRQSGGYDKMLHDYVEYFIYKPERELVFKMASRFYARRHLSLKTPFYSFQCRRLSGNSYRWYRVYVILSSADENGQVENMVVAFLDINEERQREEKQKKALKEAYDTAMKANRAKSDFLSSMSHDIRTPMNGIIGMLSIAEDHLDDSEKVSECLKKIRVASNHLMDLINDVLDMSKIESGKVNLTESEFSMRELIDSLTTVLLPLIKEKEHSFTVNVHDVTHDYLTGDTLRLNQIFINILSNSIKYTARQGQISMDITELPASSGNYADYKFVIADNGIGMSKDFLPHLFEIFTQEEKSARSEYKGTGLGMAITHNLICMMGGSVEVESQEGKGTVFTVYLPLKIVEKKEQEDSAAEENTVDVYSNCRFLLVEDNDLNREIMSEILQAKGAKVEIAVNGEEAVKMFADSSEGYYDAIFMDIQMPVMDGYEATEKIRMTNRGDADTIPIIALTANAFSEDAQRAKKVGMSTHIAKPIDFNLLDRELRRLLLAKGRRG